MTKKWLYLLLCLCLFLPSCCNSLTHRYTRTAFQLYQMNNAVVALVQYSEDEQRMLPYCTGSFISATKILTAAHCVDGDSYTNITTYGDFVAEGDNYDRFYRVDVGQVDIAMDLAILTLTSDDIPFHTTLTLAFSAPVQGENVVLVGHPLGLGWSFTEGVVSYRNRKIDDFKCYFIQHAAQASPGNSGGPLMNYNNQLVGVLSRGYTLSKHLSFSVHLDAVKTFLEKT